MIFIYFFSKKKECLLLLKRTFKELDSTCRMPKGTPLKFTTNLYQLNKDHRFLKQAHASDQAKVAGHSKKR